MGYTIQYSPESNKKYPLNKKPRNLGRVLLLLLISVALFFAVKYRTVIFRSLLPGDPDVTADALRGLISDMREGSASDAITAFCREIIDYAAK